MVVQQQSRSSFSVATASDPGKTLLLAETFQPDVDMLVSEGVISFGVKGSGKSNLVGLMAEQLGRFFLPQLILDTEREYQSLVNTLPHGVIASANRCPSGYDILHKGLQVVVDLRSWDTDEAAGLAMCQLINELFTVSNAQDPQDRVPCIIHLDEASYWLPQEAVTYLSRETRKALADAFHKLASRGRKQGLTPFLYTQSISEVSKQAIRQSGIKVLMRQTLDNDLSRYAEYIRNCTPRTKKAIQSFTSGKAIVILPDGGQHVIQLYERESEHTSHTPRTQAALAKFAGSMLDLAALEMRDFTAKASGTPPAEKYTQPAPVTRANTGTPEPMYPYKGVGRPQTKEKIVSFKFSPKTISFLDSLPKGTRTDFIERQISESKEFKQWRRDHAL
ncbi:MAG: hypothetical protein ACJ788_01620 [Ktedonobacteraceae bacterium]